MGIKLRVRVAGVDGAQKLEVPEVCTLAQLRRAVASKLLDDAWTPEEVSVSLNRVDDLGAGGASESATLRACGVARGDLVHVHRRQTASDPANPPAAPGRERSGPGADASREDDDPDTRRRRALDAAERRASERRALDAAERRAAATAGGPATLDAPSTRPSTRPDPNDPPPRTRCPATLRRVLDADRATNSAAPPLTPLQLLVASTHALFLETGLVPTDASEGFSLFRGDASSIGRLRREYALAEAPAGPACVLRAQPVGPSRVVFAGAVDVPGAPARRFDADLADVIRRAETPSDETPSDVEAVHADWLLRDARQFWSAAKDAIAAPLRADLRRAAGLPAPPALVTLPDHLKMLCLARLDFKSLCAAGSSCRELRFVADDDELWTPLHVAAFGVPPPDEAHEETHEARSKRAFAAAWRRRRAADREARRRRDAEIAIRDARRYPAPRVGIPPGGMFGGVPGYTPGITGGEYDLYPGGVGGGGFGHAGGMPGFPGSGGGGGFGGGRGGFGGGFGGFFGPGGGDVGGPRMPWPGVPGGMPGGIPTPGEGRVGRGRGRGGPPTPGWDGRPRPPDGDGDFV